MRYQSTEDRFWAKVHKVQEPNGCWEWIAGKSRKGYGRFGVGPRANGTWRLMLAHRFAYELLVGPFPGVKVSDHLCRNHGCVKVIADEFGPAHLEPVTSQENTLRGDTLAAMESRATRCIHGHPFDAGNTLVDSRGRRQCRECHNKRNRHYYQVRHLPGKGLP